MAGRGVLLIVVLLGCAAIALMSSISVECYLKRRAKRCGVAENSVVQCPGDPATFVMRGGKLRQYDYGTWAAEGKPAPVTVPCSTIQGCPRGQPYRSRAAKTPAAGVKTGRTWSNVLCNRFGSYASFGQGQGFIGTVTCTDKLAASPPSGWWTAMNPRAFGMSDVPCGMKILVTNPALRTSATVTVVDGGGSEGLDLDDGAYHALFGPNADGIQTGQPVSVQEIR